MKFKMDVNEICNYLVEEIKFNAEGLRNSNYTATDQAKNIGEILLASALLSRIFETFDEDTSTTEEASQVHTEEPAKGLDPIAAAKVIKDYCNGCKSCSECVFNVDFNVDSLGCNVKGIHHMWGIANRRINA